MNILQTIIANGYIPVIPILVWNIVFVNKMPPAFEPKSYNANIPLPLRVGETFFRIVIFTLPIFLQTNITTNIGKWGLVLFISGTSLYFASWLFLMLAPHSKWSNSIIGFTAPVFTPILWLIGLSWMFHSWYFNFPYHFWHYAIPSIGMIAFHGAHGIYIYNRIKSPATGITAAPAAS
jgi:hypothetical protein